MTELNITRPNLGCSGTGHETAAMFHFVNLTVASIGSQSVVYFPVKSRRVGKFRIYVAWAKKRIGNDFNNSAID